MAIDLIQTAVVAAVAGGVGRVAAAPLDAVAQEFTARVRERLARTRTKAEAKAGGDVHQVGDRIAYKALQEAAVTDDEIAAEYLGGVLAGSGPDDDSGAAIVALIGRLSARDLLLHYVIYREVKRLWHGPSISLGNGTEAQKAKIRIPNDDLQRLYPGLEVGIVGQAVLPALTRENLIVGYRWSAEDGLTATPTALGAALFLWGHGINCPHTPHLFEAQPHGHGFIFTTDVSATPGAALVNPPPPAEAAEGA